MKVKTELDDGNLKHTEDSTALKNAILGPQPAENEQPTPDAIPTVLSTKTEPAGSGKLRINCHGIVGLTRSRKSCGMYLLMGTVSIEFRFILKVRYTYLT